MSSARDSFPVEWEAYDHRFRAVRGDLRVERIHAGGTWLEGPVYVPARRCLLFSDVPTGRVLRWDERSGATTVLRETPGLEAPVRANGRTLDRAGRVVTCEPGARRVVRAEHDGTTTVLADRWEGRRFNGPDDVVESSDGSIWFTDHAGGPDAGAVESEVGGSHVYRVTPDGWVHRVLDDFEQPNGLAFDADEETLYVVDTGRRHVRRFAVDLASSPAQTLKDDGVLADCDAGSFDGIRLDHVGRVWAAAHDGIHVLDPDGTLLGKLVLPEVCSNLTFGGTDGNLLFVTATTSVHALMLNLRGADRP